MLSQRENSQEGAFLFTTSCLASGAFGSMLSAGSKAQSLGLGKHDETVSSYTAARHRWPLALFHTTKILRWRLVLDQNSSGFVLEVLARSDPPYLEPAAWEWRGLRNGISCKPAEHSLLCPTLLLGQNIPTTIT